jgi:hypothetical protein
MTEYKVDRYFLKAANFDGDRGDLKWFYQVPPIVPMQLSCHQPLAQRPSIPPRPSTAARKFAG